MMPDGRILDHVETKVLLFLAFMLQYNKHSPVLGHYVFLFRGYPTLEN